MVTRPSLSSPIAILKAVVASAIAVVYLVGVQMIILLPVLEIGSEWLVTGVTGGLVIALIIWTLAVFFYAHIVRRFAIAAMAVGVCLVFFGMLVLVGVRWAWGQFNAGDALPTVLTTTPATTAMIFLLLIVTYSIWFGLAGLWVYRTADSEDYLWSGLIRGKAVDRVFIGGDTLYQQDRELSHMQSDEDEQLEQTKPLFDDGDGEE